MAFGRHVPRSCASLLQTLCLAPNDPGCYTWVHLCHTCWLMLGSACLKVRKVCVEDPWALGHLALRSYIALPIIKESACENCARAQDMSRGRGRILIRSQARRPHCNGSLQSSPSCRLWRCVFGFRFLCAMPGSCITALPAMLAD